MLKSVILDKGHFEPVWTEESVKPYLEAAKNAKGKGYNPYRDIKGRFDDGLTIQDLEKMVGKEKNRERIELIKQKIIEVKEMQKKYPGRKTGEKFEAYAFRYLEENYEKAFEDYQNQVKKEFRSPIANIVAADEAKKIIPGFEAERSADYHEPGSTFVKQYYVGLLNNESSLHLPVMFTAGGTGAGKSTALNIKLQNYEDYAVVYDGNMAGFDSAVNKINAALKTGRNVEIVFVDRDPLIAFKYGVIPRTKTEGRTITIKDHIQTHLDSREVVGRIAEHFKDNPHVNISVVDNNGGIDDAHEVPLENVTNNVYNKDKLRKELEDEARQAKKDGRISETVYKLITNQEESAVSEPAHDTESQSVEVGRKQRDKRQVSVPYDTTSEEDVASWIEKEYGGISYNDTQRAAIEEYTQGTYVEINGALRGEEQSEADKQRNFKFADAMASAVKKTKLEQDSILWRGTGTDVEYKIGEVITDAGFSSTSLRDEVAKEFVESEDNEAATYKYVMRINAPKGTQGIFVQNAGVINGENEFILAPDSEFVITSITPPNEYNFEDYYIMEVDLI